ncbi:hypothetical protein WJX81_002250 [Elliptochloris bilobata]|uniref:Ankyrin repeat domain-containing protein n=1 Tax=Elliptochloris bilobata TaxID=381761 RepID=A0AAW1S1U0_9CHLO
MVAGQPQTWTYWVVEKDDYDVHPWVGLLDAVRGSDVAARGASPDARDVAYGMGALHWAAAAGDEPCLACLRERAVDVDALSWAGLSPLACAARAGHAGAVRLLLADANPNVGLPLHEAAGAGHTGIVEDLLRRRSDPGVRDNAAETALLRAARRGFVGVVEALSTGGADVDAANSAGVTPLIASSFFGHEAVVRALLTRGANARAVCARRRSALHYAALADQRPVAEALLVWASDLAQLADASGARPADLAAEADATSVLELLRRM